MNRDQRELILYFCKQHKLHEIIDAMAHYCRTEQELHRIYVESNPAAEDAEEIDQIRIAYGDLEELLNRAISVAKKQDL